MPAGAFSLKGLMGGGGGTGLRYVSAFQQRRHHQEVGGPEPRMLIAGIGPLQPS